MRLIGELDELALAKRFVAFMKTINVTTQVEEENGVWEVWVKEEDEQERAADELEKFKAEPSHSRYQGAMEKAAEIARAEERRRKQFQKNVVKVQSGSQQKTPLTILLIALCVVVALLTNFGQVRDLTTNATFRALSFTYLPNAQAEKVLEKYGSKENANVRLGSIKKGEVWRMITPIFIHFGPWHILFNMLWLFQFGKLIETKYGIVWFAILVIAIAAISNLLQCLAPENLGGSVPWFGSMGVIMALGGMSGVVYGLFGFLWVKPMVDPNCGFMLPQSTVIVLIGWLFFCGLVMGSIAHWAHGAGMVVGMIAGYLHRS